MKMRRLTPPDQVQKARSKLHFDLTFRVNLRIVIGIMGTRSILIMQAYLNAAILLRTLEFLELGYSIINAPPNEFLKVLIE